MPTKEIGPTKIAWPYIWLRSAMVDKTEPSKGIRLRPKNCLHCGGCKNSVA